jgi:hypothetical protein
MSGPASDRDAARMVTAVFPDNASLERAYEAALAHGYEKDDLNVVMSDDTRRRLVEHEPDVDLALTRKAAEGGELGGPTGLHVAVGIPVIAAAVAALAVPGLGLVAAGPLAAALTGAGAAGLAAGLMGLLADWGVPKERLQEYEKAIQDGGILVGLKARDEADARRIEQSWKALGARCVET